MTEQTWPTLPSPDAPAPGDATLMLTIVVEQNVSSGNMMHWAAEELGSFETTREYGRRQLRQIADTFAPRHPVMEQARRVYRVDPDTFLVIVNGATSTFHFTVRLVEWVGDGARQ